MSLHTQHNRGSTLRAYVTGYPDQRGCKVYILVSGAARLSRTLAMHQRGIYLDMFRFIGTVFEFPSNIAAVASTRHDDDLYLALDGETKHKSATGTANSGKRRKPSQVRS